MTQTRRKLLENFDDEVRDKLRLRADASTASLNRIERSLMRLTAHELSDHADFLNDHSFRLKASPFPGNIPLGLYELPRRSGEAHLYRLNHPLAEAIVAQAKSRELPVQEVRFNYEEHDGRITILEPLLGQSGWLSISVLTVEALEQVEDHFLFSAVADSGDVIDSEQASRLFLLPGKSAACADLSLQAQALENLRTKSAADTLAAISARNAKFFEAEVIKLDGWADDQVATSEKALKDIKKRIRELRNDTGKATDLAEQARLQGEIAEAERRQRKLRQEIFEIEDRILAERDRLVAGIRGKLNPNIENQSLFTIRWSLHGKSGKRSPSQL